MQKNYSNTLIAMAVSSIFCATAGQASDTVEDFLVITDTNQEFTAHYLDNGNGGGGPNQDWAITNNYLGTGEFTIEDCGVDCTTSAFPFIISPGAPDYSIFTNSSGQVGLGTSTPGGVAGSKLTVGVDDSGHASIDLQTATQDYVIANFDSYFGVSDMSTLEVPLIIENGALTSTLFVDSASNVGMGTDSPAAKLHVEVNDDAYKLPFIVQNTNAIGFSGFRLQIADDSWVDFNNSGGTFRINADQTPGSEFEVEANGDSKVSGTMTAMSFIQSSDRNEKQNILDINRQAVLEKVIALPITEWSYKADPTSRHIGPMAQDFFAAFQLGNTDKGLSTIDAGGVALAAIQGLKQEKDVEIAKLTADKNKEIAELQERLVQLEMALSEVLRNQSSEAQIGSIN